MQLPARQREAGPRPAAGAEETGASLPRLLLLDFDRTLADLGSHVRWDDCRLELLDWYGRNGVPAGALGPGAISLYARMAVSADLSPPRREAAQRGAASILERYEREGMEPARLLPGVGEALGGLERSGLLAGVVSSNSRAIVGEVLGRERVRHLFGAVVGREDVQRPKPAPDGLLLACRRLGGAPAEALFAGDNVADMAAAQAAGMPAVGVLGGDSGGEALREAGARAVLTGVPALLARLLAP